MRPWERDDLRRTIKLVLWFAPRDHVAAGLRWLAARIEVQERRT